MTTGAPTVLSPFTGTGGIVAFSTPGAQSHPRLKAPVKSTEVIDPVPTVRNLSLEKPDAYVEQPKCEYNQPFTESVVPATAPQGLGAIHEDVATQSKVDISSQKSVGSTGPRAGVPAFLLPDASQPELVEANNDDRHAVTKVLQLFVQNATTPTFVRVPQTCQIKDIVDAEVKLGSVHTPIHIKDAVGGPLAVHKIVDSFEQIHLHSADLYTAVTLPTLTDPTEGCVSRISLLHRQEGWVAKDELDFYLGFMDQLDGVGFVPSIVLPIFDSQTDSWLTSLFQIALHEGCASSAILHNHHWHPIVVRPHENTFHISTTELGQTFLIDSADQRVLDSHFHLLTLPVVFHADCGFQTIGSILQEVLDHTDSSDAESNHKPFPVSSRTAVAWRFLFENHLHASGLSRKRVLPSQVPFGGTLGDTPEQIVSNLLADHGVPHSEISQRTKVVFEKLSRHQILNAIRSPRPWAELKTLSNNQTPKLQLVLPSELAQMIQNRVDKKQPFGDKTKKQPKGTGFSLPIVLAPQDISIPDGIFKQGQDGLLKQIPVQAIGPEASGVVVITPQDAVPYLSRNKPISSQGLGLLLLEHSHASCVGLGSLIRFPCKCELTGEPVLATARLIQIGSIEVTKHVPSTAGTVDEVSTSVVRIAIYKDECGDEWSRIIQHPVKHVLQTLGIENTGVNTTVVDVWDRQFLSLKMTRVKAHQCELFFASLRLVGINLNELQAKSGTAGIYVEPRSIDGRSPCDRHRVIWLKHRQSIYHCCHAIVQPAGFLG